MSILITGADGYLGWPTALKLCQAFSGERIIGVDNFGRREWVQEIGSVSAIPISSMDERLEAARQRGLDNLSFIQADLADWTTTLDLIRVHKPRVILHLAAQPSAPYSHIGAEAAAFSQDNNLAMTRNLLWALRQENLLQTHYIETTTTGIFGAPSFEIPEGDLEAIGADGSHDRVPYPNMASSWYHVSKGFNVTNMRLMNFQTGLPVTNLHTSIVYGVDTAETKGDPRLATRFDFDFYFGTLFNRWCAMALIGLPLTVYGTGNQIKPFIHLEDAAQSLVLAAQATNPGDYLAYNQLTEYVRIGDLAQMICDSLGLDPDQAITHIPNPRVEKEDREYQFRCEKFLELLGGQPRTMSRSLDEIMEPLAACRQVVLSHQDRLTSA